MFSPSYHYSYGGYEYQCCHGGLINFGGVSSIRVGGKKFY